MRCAGLWRSLASTQPMSGRGCVRRMRPASPQAAGVEAAAAVDHSHSQDAPRFVARDGRDSRHRCPVCANDVRGRTARAHLRKCAPDLVDSLLAAGPWPTDPAAVFAAATLAEAATLVRLKQLRFREEQSWEATSQVLGVPEKRLRGMLRRDSLGMELVRDTEPLEILHEDAELLVTSKPPDLRAHPIHRFQGGSMLNRAAGHAHRTAPGSPIPAVVHRLDQDTSGVMLFAKDRSLAGAISEQFAKKTVHKEYLAICLGTPQAVHFTVDAPIARHPVHAPARMLAIGGKAARTKCSVIAYRPPSGGRPGAALMRAAPETGRTHQIRLHLAAAGVPIVLDPFYLGPSLEVACGAHWPLAMTRQALHAASLSLHHPVSGQQLFFEAPLPEDMTHLGQCLGLLDETGAVKTDGSVLTSRGDGAAELAAALGGVAQASLVFETGNCVQVQYRDDVGDAPPILSGEDEEDSDE